MKIDVDRNLEGLSERNGLLLFWRFPLDVTKNIERLSFYEWWLWLSKRDHGIDANVEVTGC